MATKRLTDMTPAEIGDGVRFRVMPNIPGTQWTVWSYFGSNDTDDYDGRGKGDTIEQAIAAAIADMNDD